MASTSHLIFLHELLFTLCDLLIWGQIERNFLSVYRFHHDRQPAMLLWELVAGCSWSGRESGIHTGGRHLLPGLPGLIYIPHRQ